MDGQRLTDEEGSPGVVRDVELPHEDCGGELVKRRYIGRSCSTYVFTATRVLPICPDSTVALRHSVIAAVVLHGWRMDAGRARSAIGRKRREERKEGMDKTHPSEGRGDMARGKVRPQGSGGWIRALHYLHVLPCVRLASVRIQHR